MVRTAVVLLAVAGLTVAAPVKQKGPGDAPSELEGKWVVKEAQTLGGIDQPHLANTVILIRGTEYTATAKAVSQGRVKVDGTARPKRLEFEVQTIDGKPAATDKKGRWIYELDGDELRMASLTDSDGTLPERIDPADRKQMIWKAKRVKD
jgi:uncharacterized protein (TIGR03067 family)